MKTTLIATRLALALAAFTALPARAAPPPVINVHFILHADVQMNEQDFVSEHVSAWLGHMRADVVPGQPIQIHVHRQLDGLENTPYGHEGALGEWAHRAAPVLARLGNDDGRATRMVLVTQGGARPEALGLAYEGSPFAIASVRDSTTVAHELGHTFAAIHEDAESWAFCETNMADPVYGRWPCEVYSKKNQDRIRAYIEGP